MQKEFSFSTVIILTLVGYFFIHTSGLNGFVPEIVLMPLILLAIATVTDKLTTMIARVLIPICYGVFSMGLFSVCAQVVKETDLYYTPEVVGIRDAVVMSFDGGTNFFNAIIVIFSVTAAFLLVKGLQDFDRLKETLNTEAEMIWAIVFLTSYLREHGSCDENKNNIEATDTICMAFQQYIHKVVGVDDRRHRLTSLNLLKKSDDLIDTCVKATKKVQVKNNDENDLIALEEIMKKLSELVSIRSKRRIFMNNSIPPYVLASIFFMSISLLVPFFVNGSNVFSINHIYVFLLSSIHMFIIMTLFDLSSPFDGYFSIQLEAFSDAGRRIDELIATRKKLGQPDAIQPNL